MSVYRLKQGQFVYKCKGMMHETDRAVGISNKLQRFHELFSFLTKHENAWIQYKGYRQFNKLILMKCQQFQGSFRLMKPDTRLQEKLYKSTRSMARSIKRKIMVASCIHG